MKRSGLSVALLGFGITLMLVACTQPTTVKFEGQREATSPHGKELWLSVVPLTGVGRVNANGAAQAHYFEDGTFVLSLGLNIDPASKGSLYTGWLIREDGTDVQPIGILVNLKGDVRHQASFQSTKDLRDHPRLQITLADEASAGEPGRLVAEGFLKQVRQ